MVLFSIKASNNKEILEKLILKVYDLKKIYFGFLEIKFVFVFSYD